MPCPACGSKNTRLVTRFLSQNRRAVMRSRVSAARRAEIAAAWAVRPAPSHAGPPPRWVLWLAGSLLLAVLSAVLDPLVKTEGGAAGAAAFIVFMLGVVVLVARWEAGKKALLLAPVFQTALRKRASVCEDCGADWAGERPDGRPQEDATTIALRVMMAPLGFVGRIGAAPVWLVTVAALGFAVVSLAGLGQDRLARDVRDGLNANQVVLERVGRLQGCVRTDPATRDSRLAAFDCQADGRALRFNVRARPSGSGAGLEVVAGHYIDRDGARVELVVEAVTGAK